MTAQPAAPLLEISDLRVHFRRRAGGGRRSAGDVVRAVDGVSLNLDRGQTLGLVGESGCGKSTLARAVLRLVTATSGRIRFDGGDITTLNEGSVRKLRPRMQMVFQDAGAALNPRWRVRQLIGEPLVIHRRLSGSALRSSVDRLLEIVGLQQSLAPRLPRQLSGGQRQRVGIARALALEPDLVVCDEPTSALDLSIQAQVIELLRDLQQRMGLSYLLIAHDLGVVRQLSDRVAVMYLGKIVEVASPDELFGNPCHPYSELLLSSVPVPDPMRARTAPRARLAAELPSSSSPPLGCNFCTRCPAKDDVRAGSGIDCDRQEPELIEVSPGHRVACHLHRDPLAGADPTGRTP